MANPGTKSASLGNAIAEFKGQGLVNFNGGNRIIREINRRVGGGAFGPAEPPALIIRRIQARITGNTRDGSNYRWKYSWEQVYKKTGGYGGWQTLVGGYSGSSTDPSCAYNRLEDINTTTGMTGIGVSLDNIPNGFSLQPIPNHTPVMIDVVILSDGTTEYWFSVSNGIDGTCG